MTGVYQGVKNVQTFYCPTVAAAGQCHFWALATESIIAYQWSQGKHFLPVRYPGSFGCPFFHAHSQEAQGGTGFHPVSNPQEKHCAMWRCHARQGRWNRVPPYFSSVRGKTRFQEHRIGHDIQNGLFRQCACSKNRSVRPLVVLVFRFRRSCPAGYLL